MYPQRGQRIADGIAQHATGDNGAALACTLGTEGIERRRMLFGDDCTHLRIVTGGWHQIIGQRTGEQLTLFVIHQMFQEHATNALHGAAHQLAMHRQRVDGATDILHHHVVEQVDAAGGGIDGDMRRGCAIGIGVVMIGEGAVNLQFTSLTQLCKGNALALGRDCFAIGKVHIRRFAIEHSRCAL